MSTVKTTIKYLPETKEYLVKLWVNGKHMVGADYYTDDEEDAEGTANEMLDSAEEQEAKRQYDEQYPEADNPPRANNPGWLSLTYGKMPSGAEFRAHFEENVDGEYYRVEMKGKDAVYLDSGEYNDVQLETIVHKLTKQWENGDDGAGDLASSILQTLQIEWI